MKHTSFLSVFANIAGLQRGIIFFFGVLLCLNFGYAQVNLVQNPSFEEYSSCPNALDQLNRAKHWHKPIAGGGNTPDYYNACADTNGLSFTGVPKQNLLSDTAYQMPHYGNAYARFATYLTYTSSPNYLFREYIQTQLMSSLMAGQTYCVTFYVNLYDDCNYAVDEIGVYFDNGSVVAPTSQGYCNKIPQIKSPTGLMLKDTAGWTKISQTFIATGVERFLTIGNFRDNQNTNKEFLYTAQVSSSAYLIDDVSVIPSDLPAYAGEDTVISPGDSVFIGRQPEIGLECVWHSNGQQVGTGAGIWVKPTQTTSYIVTQDLCGNIQQDTVIVYVFPTSVQVPLYLQSVQLYPNPAHHMITLSLPQAQGQQLSLQLISPEGKSLWQGATQSEETDIPLPAESGVYFLEIRDDATGGRIVKKVVRE